MGVGDLIFYVPLTFFFNSGSKIQSVYGGADCDGIGVVTVFEGVDVWWNMVGTMFLI